MNTTPLLVHLPPPPSGRTGWPWTESGPPLPSALPDGSPWPRLTIVTPSRGQGEFVEATIRSVLLQGYPALEYIIIDGGSTDGSVDVIRKYAPWLSHWVSEPDRGQSHAINKGLSRATGELFGYLNSDDLLVPGALGEIARGFHTARDAAVVYGACAHIDVHGTELVIQRGVAIDLEQYLRIWTRFGTHENIAQPAVFCRTRALLEVGGFREDLHFAMDSEMWMRLLSRGHRFESVDAVVAKFRRHPEQKTALTGRAELYDVTRAYLENAAEIPRLARRKLRRELAHAEAVYLAWSAVASSDRKVSGKAAMFLRSVRAYPPVLATYEYWSALITPFLPWIPDRLQRVLKRLVGKREHVEAV